MQIAFFFFKQLVTCFNPFPICTKQRVSTLLSGKRATGRRKHKGRNREQTKASSCNRARKFYLFFVQIVQFNEEYTRKINLSLNE